MPLVFFKYIATPSELLQPALFWPNKLDMSASRKYISSCLIANIATQICQCFSSLNSLSIHFYDIALSGRLQVAVNLKKTNESETEIVLEITLDEMPNENDWL